MENAVLSPESREISNLASLIDAEIAQVARQAAAEAAQPPVLDVPRVAWRPFASYRALCVSWLLCLGLTLANLEVGGLFTPRSIDPAPAKLVAGLETSAAMDAVLIESYRSEHGTLPLSLSAVGLPDDDPTLAKVADSATTLRELARLVEPVELDRPS